MNKRVEVSAESMQYMQIASITNSWRYTKIAEAIRPIRVRGGIISAIALFFVS